MTYRNVFDLTFKSEALEDVILIQLIMLLKFETCSPVILNTNGISIRQFNSNSGVQLGSCILRLSYGWFIKVFQYITVGPKEVAWEKCFLGFFSIAIMIHSKWSEKSKNSHGILFMHWESIDLGRKLQNIVCLSIMALPRRTWQQSSQHTT